MSKKILIVDDEPDIVEFQKSFLSRRNHIVDTAKNTSEAISLITARAPDIIFCDVRLDSDRAGLEILERAKKIKPEVVFYLVTGLLDKEIEAKGVSLGAKEILTKPITNELLEKKVNEV